MKVKIRRLFVVLVILAISFGYSEAQEETNSQESFCFAVFGDCRGRSFAEPINLKVLNPMVSKIAGLNPLPELVLFMGDIAWTADPRYLETFKDNISVFSGKKIPVYLTLGNHEIRKISPRLAGQEVFQSAFDMPKNGPAGYEELAYYFEYKNALFVCLDSFYVDPKRPNKCYYNMITEEQIAWLEGILKSSDKRWKFVFSHAPAFPVFTAGALNHDSWEELWEVLDTNKVDIYFCGHEHLYSRWRIDSRLDPKWKNGVIQIIAGGGGAALPKKSAVPDTNPDAYKGAFSYVVADIDSSRINLTAFDLEGKRIDNFKK